MLQTPRWLEDVGRLSFLVVLSAALFVFLGYALVFLGVGVGYASEQWMQARNGEDQCREQVSADLDQSPYGLGRGMQASMYGERVTSAVLVIPFEPASNQVWTAVCHFWGTGSFNLWDIQTQPIFREYEVLEGNQLDRIEGLSMPLLSMDRIVEELRSFWADFN